MRRPGEDDELDDRDHELIAKLRALPPEGTEPNWQKLEAAIRAEVGDRAPRPWWRNWKWIIPVWALATTAAVALIVMRDHDAPAPQHALTSPSQHDTPSTQREVTNAPAMWLDGEALNLDDVDDASLDNLDQAAREVLDTDDVGLDELDDAALDEIEQWLEKERS
ncbi:MAG TPA: hypothetical protein VMZ53_13205 [Kofleriaceae bacterium]|nr:hypothetical protein [Kofleriaceae bacterium]